MSIDDWLISRFEKDVIVVLAMSRVLICAHISTYTHVAYLTYNGSFATSIYMSLSNRSAFDRAQTTQIKPDYLLI